MLTDPPLLPQTKMGQAPAKAELKVDIKAPPKEVSEQGGLSIPQVSIAFGIETLLLIAATVWALWERSVRPKLIDKMVGVWAPVEEERALETLVAQSAVIAGCDRAILVAFHNGIVDENGYHLHRMTTVKQYVQTGCEGMPYPIKDIPVARIWIELGEMMRTMTWTPIYREQDQPKLCQQHLERNDIHCMVNRVLLIGNLPIGILSMQWTHELDRKNYFTCRQNMDQMKVLDSLHDQVTEIMRRRVIKPPLFTRLRVLSRQITQITRP